mmetsp:Transcript_579/g.1249  ORF Transcript_579/g.1249 Transcript_579/m.1249 type:complete len:283 (-) Transcript_579:7-855(-)
MRQLVPRCPSPRRSRSHLAVVALSKLQGLQGAQRGVPHRIPGVGAYLLDEDVFALQQNSGGPLLMFLFGILAIVAVIVVHSQRGPVRVLVPYQVPRGRVQGKERSGFGGGNDPAFDGIIDVIKTVVVFVVAGGIFVLRVAMVVVVAAFASLHGIGQDIQDGYFKWFQKPFRRGDVQLPIQAGHDPSLVIVFAVVIGIVALLHFLVVIEEFRGLDERHARVESADQCSVVSVQNHDVSIDHAYHQKRVVRVAAIAVDASFASAVAADQRGRCRSRNGWFFRSL